ncbi:winged helix-turn-helix domain-containing protein [bacterium]|nr:winged helix-turn-helix domain-containing protein [bacterium]
MARPKELLDEELVSKANEELEKLSNYKVCIRLKAIISCKDYPINHVSEIYGINRSSLWNWIKRFKAGGVLALYDKPRGHNPAKLNKEYRSKISSWLEENKDHKGKPVHWTLRRLLSDIEKVFGIKTSQTALWSAIRAMGFRQKVPRPYHAKADKNEQERFKKRL